MKLKVGDVCIVIASALPEFPVGTEVVIEGLNSRAQTCKRYPYIVGELDGRIVIAGDTELRLKDFPRQQTSTWDRCVWQPRGVTA